MAITIDGSGTITGISAGGLPDGSVTADDLATDSVTTAKIEDSAVTAGKLSGKTFVSYAVICDQKASNADGGTFLSGAWRTRDLNTEIFDPDGIVSISSNQFTLGTVGTYFIKFSAPASQVNSHQAVLFDITGSAFVQLGSTEHSASAGSQTRSEGCAHVTITAPRTYEIQHRCGLDRSTYGFGVGTSGSFTWGDTIYTLVEIYKEAG